MKTFLLFELRINLDDTNKSKPLASARAGIQRETEEAH